MNNGQREDRLTDSEGAGQLNFFLTMKYDDTTSLSLLGLSSILDARNRQVLAMI